MSEAVVVEVGDSQVDEAIEVLAESFFNYPTMRYVLRGSGPSYPLRLRSMIGFFVRTRHQVGSPVLGVAPEGGDGLAAIAVVDPPERLPGSEADLSGADLAESIGADAMTRLADFDRAITELEPDNSFYYLGMVGVLSRYRGRGYSRLLMDRVVSLSAADDRSEGVLLTTEHESNIPIYESMGFEVLGDTNTSDGLLRSWTMFRPDSAG